MEGKGLSTILSASERDQSHSFRPTTHCARHTQLQSRERPLCQYCGYVGRSSPAPTALLSPFLAVWGLAKVQNLDLCNGARFTSVGKPVANPPTGEQCVRFAHAILASGGRHHLTSKVSRIRSADAIITVSSLCLSGSEQQQRPGGHLRPWRRRMSINNRQTACRLSQTPSLSTLDQSHYFTPQYHNPSKCQ